MSTGTRGQIVIEEIISHLSRFLKNDYASGDTSYYNSKGFFQGLTCSQ